MLTRSHTDALALPTTPLDDDDDIVEPPGTVDALLWHVNAEIEHLDNKLATELRGPGLRLSNLTLRTAEFP